MSTKRYESDPRGTSDGRRLSGHRRHHISAKQLKWYWREWRDARKALIAAGYSAVEADSERHELHRKALGSDVSSKQLTNEGFEKVLAAFRALSQPGDLASQLSAQQGHRRRLLHSLEKLAKGREAYVEDICLDAFDTRQWRRLPDADLERLRATLERRVVRRKGAEPVSVAEVEDEVEDSRLSEAEEALIESI